MYIPTSTLKRVASNEAAVIFNWGYGKRRNYVLALVNIGDNYEIDTIRFVRSGSPAEICESLDELAKEPGISPSIKNLKTGLTA